MLFVARPETPMAKACERGEAYGVEGYRRVSLDELDELYPGEAATTALRRLPQHQHASTHHATLSTVLTLAAALTVVLQGTQ